MQKNVTKNNKSKVKQLKTKTPLLPHVYNNCYINPILIHSLRLLLNQYGTISNYSFLVDSCYRLSSIIGLSSDADDLLQQLFQEFLQGLCLFDADSININIDNINITRE
jgi:hypothetical protein